MSGREVVFMLATGILWGSVTAWLRLSVPTMIVGGLFLGAIGQYVYSELTER